MIQSCDETCCATVSIPSNFRSAAASCRGRWVSNRISSSSFHIFPSHFWWMNNTEQREGKTKQKKKAELPMEPCIRRKRFPTDVTCCSSGINGSSIRAPVFFCCCCHPSPPFQTSPRAIRLAPGRVERVLKLPKRMRIYRVDHPTIWLYFICIPIL